MTLPWDILCEIGAYWAGHRLHYTCMAVYVSWNPDHHVVTKSWSIDRRTYTESITTTRMPNGVYHGKSSTTWHYKIGVPTIEIVEYNRGVIVSTVCKMGKYYRVANLINGWQCWWKHDEFIPDALGCVDASNNVCARKRLRRSGVALCDFVAVASELVAQTSEHGGYTELPIMSKWG